MKIRFLLIALVLLLFMGCKKNPEQEWDDFDSMIQNGETQAPAKGDEKEEKKQGVAANTNYQAKTIDLPEKVTDGTETLLSITAGESTPLELYALGGANGASNVDSYRKYILLDSGEWELRDWKLSEQIDAFLEAQAYSSLSLSNIKRGKDGNLYALGNASSAEDEDEGEDDEARFRRMFGSSMLFSLGVSGEELSEIPLVPPENEESDDPRGGGFWIAEFDAFESGELYVQFNGIGTIVDPFSGEIIKSYDSETAGANRGFNVVNLGQNEIFNVEVMASKFNIIEAVTGDPISSIPHVVHERSNMPSWRATSTDKGIFLADISGIYKADSFTAGEFHQLIASADSNDLTNLFMSSLIVDEYEDVYIVFFDMGGATFGMNGGRRGGASANRSAGAEEASDTDGAGFTLQYKLVKYSPSTE